MENTVWLYDILIALIIGLIGVVIPGGFTLWNVYNLFSKKPKIELLAAYLTILIGGVLYLLLYILNFDLAGDWYEVIKVTQLHNVISSKYQLGMLLPTLVGITGLLILISVAAEKLPPLVSAFLVASVILLNVMQIAFAIQISKNILNENMDVFNLLFYVYHFNIFILSVSAVRKQLKQQLEIYRQMNFPEKESRHSFVNWLYSKINHFSKYTALLFACLFFLIAILEIIFILVGQGADAPIKAFTDTADWTFSKQIPPPPLEYDGHYLCTVAASGHTKIVKPLRYGTRRGTTIIVNRQLCIANAFEDYIQEKLPRFHKFIRGVYDKYGYPISKHITTPARADVVYFVMKPLEWIFLIFLYLFDVKPEQRISRQYLYQENEKERERAQQERIAREHAENEVKRLQKLLELEKNK